MAVNQCDPGQAILDRIAALARQRSALDAEISAEMLAFEQLREAEASKHDDAHLQALARSAVPDELSLVLQQSPYSVQGRLFDARQVKDYLPEAWKAHTKGGFDAGKVRIIAQALGRLERSESFEVLDSRVNHYATTHTPGQLRAWLRRWVVRLEPDLVIQRHQRQLADRHVWFEHLDDNISWFHVMCSSTDAVLVERELTLRAKTAQAISGDSRTLAQACSDSAIDAILGRNEVSAGRGRFHIGITVPISGLLGLDDEPAEAVDGSFALPRQLLRELAAQPGTLFSRIVIDPAGDVLNMSELGRFPSAALRRSLEMIDGVCVFPTCQRPALNCDLDHVEPYPTGPTSASNLWNLCRRHHKLKTFGVFETSVTRDGRHRWTLPTGKVVESRAHIQRGFI